MTQDRPHRAGKRLRFTPCACGASHYRLLPRKWWMRVFVGRRRYRCRMCKATLLLPGAKVNVKRTFLRAVVVLLAVIATMYVVEVLQQVDEHQRRKGEEARQE
ncbi:hypothetical protein [Ramlibacter montanisoli]|uniref:Uncharacterized protein n=1 Tax=Ramlibacter montanisoli TaxID=2732512 RepID=A0A849K5L1_9BURK|nr:hypothetical protein [Ramlibacter montanisoli]NNU43678.1 hypothetical protein [Ramlibacter montanisoli]